MVLALATSLASAQATPATLSLGDAARLAALRSAPVVAARHRAEQADARVTQRRADLLPNVSASAVENGRTLNTATFGIDFPSPPAIDVDVQSRLDMIAGGLMSHGVNPIVAKQQALMVLDRQISAQASVLAFPRSTCSTG